MAKVIAETCSIEIAVSNYWRDEVVEELGKFFTDKSAKFVVVSDTSTVVNNWDVAISVWAGASSLAGLSLVLLHDFRDGENTVGDHGTSIITNLSVIKGGPTINHIDKLVEVAVPKNKIVHLKVWISTYW